MKRAALIAILTLSLGFMPATAQVAPEAQAVLNAYIEATGGKSAKENVNSLRMIGRYKIEAQGIEAALTIQMRKPGLLSMNLEIPNVGQVRSAFDGEVGWEENPITGFRYLEGLELDQMRKQGVIFPELAVSTYYQTITRKDDAPDGRHVLHLISLNQEEETWFFDPLSHLLTGMRMSIDAGEQGAFPVDIDLGDYRDVSGMKLPFSTVTRNPAFSIAVLIDEMEVNGSLDESAFTAPQ
jgi:hypothetical protein